MGRTKAKKKTKRRPIKAVITGIRRWTIRLVLLYVGLVFLAVIAFAVINPSTTPYMASERARLGAIDRTWVDLEEVAPVVARSVAASEDANFCVHWGFDMAAIRQVIESGENRGASTLTQQTVKNVFLWPNRSWARKAMEATITPVVELIWSKRRIMEVYLNVAEFDEGVFGIEAAAFHYFRKSPMDLTSYEAGLLAAVLPNPKDRSASNPGAFTRNRAVSVADGAETLRRDGRAACFAPS